MKKRLITIAILTILQPACSSLTPEQKAILTEAGTTIIEAGTKRLVNEISGKQPVRTSGKQPIPTR